MKDCRDILKGGVGKRYVSPLQSKLKHNWDPRPMEPPSKKGIKKCQMFPGKRAHRREWHWGVSIGRGYQITMRGGKVKRKKNYRARVHEECLWG